MLGRPCGITPTAHYRTAKGLTGLCSQTARWQPSASASTGSVHMGSPAQQPTLSKLVPRALHHKIESALCETAIVENWSTLQEIMP